MPAPEIVNYGVGLKGLFVDPRLAPPHPVTSQMISSL